ncbi:hypothetical protein [Methylocystis echinoides]|uniref:Uncharacterized protein n=1 Tax=Methylocystis echinoides TaxID=29468 RepID=A0A9W6GY16_9HYPH|nr:hypothetical protein [Methylocystis echinoides]RTL85979.1 MAG: hypothetical protein EKK29_10695 [Hyphomicrobiales bacterium]GLI95102.1 hypothetical protein LMG27198_40940 [Methylocystis echinoides]
MTAIDMDSLRSRTAIGLIALPVASILFTLGFACAVPLAAFAAIAATSSNRRDALAAIGAAWLANQAWGFVFRHYPMDWQTFAWGGALGVIAVLSCEAAGAATRQLTGVVGACAAFLAAFLVYEGSLIAIDLVADQNAEDFSATTVLRIFLINACAFGGLWALKILFKGMSFARKVSETLASRQI